ncbi:MAG: thymidylate kinase [Prevotellaceae bacterium]|jgi:dTMP kinase|nr:thymidylate kinase [Prevotellaceae bacterium]
MFIVLEGLDGAGKSTQAALLREHLASLRHETEFMHFPRFDRPVFGELAARFLRGDFGAVEAVNPYLVALLYAGNRFDAAPTLRRWIDAGVSVVLDRYVYSNIAYQCAKLDDPAGQRALRQWIWHMEYGYFAIPQPDLTVFLDVPLQHVEKKLAETRDGDDRLYLQGKKDIHESDLPLQHKVRRIYLEQAALDANFHIIDCAATAGGILPPQEIFEKLKGLTG